MFRQRLTKNHSYMQKKKKASLKMYIYKLTRMSRERMVNKLNPKRFSVAPRRKLCFGWKPHPCGVRLVEPS